MGIQVPQRCRMGCTLLLGTRQPLPPAGLPAAPASAVCRALAAAAAALPREAACAQWHPGWRSRRGLPEWQRRPPRSQQAAVLLAGCRLPAVQAGAGRPLATGPPAAAAWAAGLAAAWPARAQLQGRAGERGHARLVSKPVAGTAAAASPQSPGAHARCARRAPHSRAHRQAAGGQRAGWSGRRALRAAARPRERGCRPVPGCRHAACAPCAGVSPPFRMASRKLPRQAASRQRWAAAVLVPPTRGCRGHRQGRRRAAAAGWGPQAWHAANGAA